MIQPLQYLHSASGAGKVGRGDETVVPAADDDDVGLGHRSAKVALDLVGRAYPGLAGIAAGLAQCPALPKQIPALVERHFDRMQSLVFIGFVDLMLLQLAPQLLFLGDQLVHLSENVFVPSHDSSLPD